MILRRRYIYAPVFVFLIIAILFKVSYASEMPLGAIIIQLRSTVDAANATELNERFGDATTKYLNEYFGAYYTRTEQMPKDYFSKTDLSLNSIGVHGVEGSFITTIEVEGTLSFNSDAIPSSDFIDTLLRNAFKGRNEQLYLDQLLKSDNEFLKNLTYLIIDIIKSDDTESPIREDGTSTAANIASTSGSNEERPQESAKRTSGEKWILAVICITSLILSLLTLFSTYIFYRRCKKRKETKNTKNGIDKEPMKVIKLPVKQQKPSSRPSNSNESNNIDTTWISPTSTATTIFSPASIGVQMDRPPPSPQRSMTSQASSIFTYTDNMSRLTTHNTTNRSLLKPVGSPFSKFSLDVPSIDLSMGRGGRQDPPAFGSDISVIAKQNDLSLIPEEQEDIEAGLKNNKTNNFRRDNSSNRHLSRKSRVALDARQSNSRFSNRSETYFYSGRHDDNDSDAELEVSANDVICDLKNLSMQIERQRKSNRSRRALNP